MNTTTKTFNKRVHEEYRWEVMGKMFSNYIEDCYEVRDTETNKRLVVVVKK